MPISRPGMGWLVDPYDINDNLRTRFEERYKSSNARAKHTFRILELKAYACDALPSQRYLQRSEIIGRTFRNIQCVHDRSDQTPKHGADPIPEQFMCLTIALSSSEPLCHQFSITVSITTTDRILEFPMKSLTKE